MAILSNEPSIIIHDQRMRDHDEQRDRDGYFDHEKHHGRHHDHKHHDHDKPRDSIEIGANFTGATVDASGFIPPDTNGAVGPDHFVELLNGVYSVYDKSGVLLERSSLDAFWTRAGVQLDNFSFDPRVLYDP